MRPRVETITRRRRERANVRNVLGPHSSDAPTMRACVRVVRASDELLKLTTDGRYRVVITGPYDQVAGWLELDEIAEGWREG